MLGAGRLEKKGQRDEAKLLRKKMRALPVLDPDDPNYRRLRYVRCADDFLLGFVGPKSEAEEIKSELRDFLANELRLELSDAKTFITYARTDAARFFGYEVAVMFSDHVHHKGRRSLNGSVGLRVPMDVIRAKCKPYMRRGKPIHRAERMKRHRVQHHRRFPVGIPGRRRVLPAGEQPAPAEHAEVGDGAVAP
jgi:hypothetical protein